LCFPYNLDVPTQSAKIGSLHFKALVRAVLKFPPSASVSSSEIINLEVSKGRLRATVFGLVEASAAVLATGEGMDAFSVDYRVLSPYVELCPDAPVTIEIGKNQVLFTCLEHKLKIPFTVGRIAAKKTLGSELFIADIETSKAIRWLASIVDRGEAKPDTSCVYVHHARAISMNQYCIAISQVKGLPNESFALPLALCAVLADGDKVTSAKDGLIVASELGVYSIPFLSATLNFPVKLIDRLLNSDGEILGVCEVPPLAVAFKESADCVARIPKVTANVTLTFGEAKLEVYAHSATADYTTTMAVVEGTTGKVSFPLLEAEAAIDVFGEDSITIKRLEPKKEVALLGTEACVFFAREKLG
jgi:hypothetical protein